jgi:hypothetical protein
VSFLGRKSGWGYDGGPVFRYIRAGLLGTLVSLSAVSVAIAQTVHYCGIELPVESLAPVQGGQTRVTLNQKDFLVSTEEIGAKVAAAYAAQPALLAKRVEWDSVVSLITQCAKTSDPLTVPLIQATLAAEHFLPTKSRDLYRSLASSPPSNFLLDNAVASFDPQASNPASWCEALTVLRESTRRLIQEKSSQMVYRYQFQCTEYLQKRARAVLGSGNLPEGLAFLDTLIQMFADGSPRFIELIASRNRLVKLLESVNNADYASVSRIIRTLSEDSWIAPFAIDLSRGVIHLALEKAISEGKIGSALRLLVAIDFQRRTPSDHQFIIRTLEKVSAADLDALMSDPVSVALSAFSRKDEGVAGAYLTALERLLTGSLEKGNLVVSDKILERIFTIRPDPSDANDRLRIEFTGKLLDAGAIFEARNVAAELQIRRPPLLYMRLLLSGAYWDRDIVIAALVAVVLAVVLVVWGRRRVRSENVTSFRKPRDRSRKAKSDRGEEEIDDRDTPPRRFVVYSHGVSLGQGPDEYTELLKVFALRPGVSLQKIKVAYRNAVKTCHPDLNPNAGEVEASQFIHLTRTYERLLDILEQRTGEK